MQEKPFTLDVYKRQVFHRSNVDMECSGMGTTLVAALAGPHETVILNEGDSRAYHVTPEGITRVTRDHSLVEDLVERGDLTRDQARVCLLYTSRCV